MGVRPSAAIVTSDFSPSEMAIVVARRTSMHADEYQGFGRMPRGLFADDFWPRLSVAGLSAVLARLVSFDLAAIVREMISRWVSIAPSYRYLLTGYCRRVNWTRS